MPEFWFAIPGDLATLTGGYVYARRLMEALPAVGWLPRFVGLPAGFPQPSEADLAAVRNSLAQVAPGSTLLVDGLAFGALPKDLLQSFDFNYIALVHHPLASETGLSDSEIKKFMTSERAALSLARAVIATSPHTAETLIRDYGVESRRLTVALPGTDPATRAAPQNAQPQLLTVATLTYRKGHDILVNALSRLTDLAWSCLLVGSLERDPNVTANVSKLIAQHGLRDRVALRGELAASDLDAAYAAADIFVLPSRHEGYGMAFAEALARGLPIVACASGAVTGTVPPNAGILVPPDDSAALANALRLMISDYALRQKTADAAWSSGRRLPTWNDTAGKIAQALERVCS